MNLPQRPLTPSTPSTALSTSLTLTSLTQHPLTNQPSARHAAQQAATRRLLNAYLRETGTPDPRPSTGDQSVRVVLPATGRVLLGMLSYWSMAGHHGYGHDWTVQHTPDQAPIALDHSGVAHLLLDELAAAALAGGHPSDAATVARRRTELAAQIDNSVERTARYLARGRPSRPGADDQWAVTRYAEQSVLFGHPLHPTPKSAEGFSADDVAAYAPELGACFALHYFAVAPDLVVQRRIGPGPWIPDQVGVHAQRRLAPACRGYALLPAHPFQADYLLRQEPMQRLVASGACVPLGALGPVGYPTSSVRTVCVPAFATAWKLPLHVRITNFIRTNPVEHARRSADASLLIGCRRGALSHRAGFEVLVETGHQALNHPDLAAETCVIYRENPFAYRFEAPQVLAGLLDEHPDGSEPDLLRHIRTATGDADGALSTQGVVDWLTAYLAISLLPLLEVFSHHGISLEAHVQNSLLHLDNGWPARFYVRDMEGTSASRQRITDVLEPDSPLLYDEDEAWLRWQYYVITNHLGHLLHVLGRYGQLDERRLWAVVADALRGALPDPYAARLLASDVLPAKANLLSRFADRSERPLHVNVPNPIREVTR